MSLLSFGQNTKGDIELGFNTGINFSQVGNNTGNSDEVLGEFCSFGRLFFQ
jgi:hypothetical protein